MKVDSQFLRTNPNLNKQRLSMREASFRVCQQEYSVLGRTPRLDLGAINHWQFEPGYPPSYSAQARYRFLQTLEIADSLKPKSILEVACGGGFNGACLWRVVLNDLRLEHQDINVWKTGRYLEAVPGNLFELDPETLGSFDLVIACEVIEHIAHGDQFVQHLKRFLTPQGTLLLTTPNGLYFRSKLPTYSQITDFSALEKEQFKPDADGHLYLYSPNEITDLLCQEGFTNINVYLSITPWITGHVGLRFLPSTRWLVQLYYQLNEWSSNFSESWKRKICFQMIVTATLS